MKKFTALFMAFFMLFTLTACKKGGENADDNGGDVSGDLKLGLAVITKLSGSGAGGESDGNAQSESTACAVLLDADGKIADCVIDVAQNKIDFDTSGKIIDKGKAFLTKRELKDEYGMRDNSEIGKEWFEQASGFCEYVKGKTVSDISGISLDASGFAEEEDIRSTTTIKIGEFIDALSSACADAKTEGAKSGDTLALGIYTHADDSADASESGNGSALAYSTYCALTLDSGGRITSAIIDSTQAAIEIDAEGEIVTEFDKEKVRSKNDLGNEYGMLDNSDIGKEWFEQAEGFCEYITGKTRNEVKGISVDEETVPADEDLRATTTIAIGDFLKAADRAF